MKQREIKFRFWNKGVLKWINPESMAISGGGSLLEHQGFGEYNDINNTNEVYYAVNQFTGILDKNGKEIYEGDILKWDLCEKDETCSVVKWISENDKWDYTGWMLRDSYNQYGPCEVVGNIFENPELVK